MPGMMNQMIPALLQDRALAICSNVNPVRVLMFGIVGPMSSPDIP